MTHWRVPKRYVDQTQLGHEIFVPIHFSIHSENHPVKFKLGVSWNHSQVRVTASSGLHQQGLSGGRRMQGLGCSSRYLYILFIRDIGRSPKHWMKLERMVVARRKLEGGKSPKTSQGDLGFMSIHTFSGQFQRFYHMTTELFQRDRKTFDQYVSAKTGQESRCQLEPEELYFLRLRKPSASRKHFAGSASPSLGAAGPKALKTPVSDG